MRFNTHINNQKAIEWGLNANQAALFDLLNQSSSWAKDVTIDGQVFYWVSRNRVIEELPLFYSKTDTVYRHFVELAKKELISYQKQGEKDLIKLTEKGKTWNEFTKSSSEIDPNELGNKSDARKQIRISSEIDPTNNNTNNNINNTHPYPPTGGKNKNLALRDELIGLLKENFCAVDAKTLHDDVFDFLVKRGYECIREFPVKNRGDGRVGRIDLLVQKQGAKVGVEIDYETAREKSIFKLNQATPNAGLVLLREGVVEREEIDGVVVVSADVRLKRSKGIKFNFNEIANAWNEANENAGSQLPFVEKVNDERRRAIKKFLVELREPTLECVEKYFKAFFAALKPHHLGENDRGWRANFDFAIKPKQVLRVREGAL